MAAEQNLLALGDFSRFVLVSSLPKSRKSWSVGQLQHAASREKRIICDKTGSFCRFDAT